MSRFFLLFIFLHVDFQLFQYHLLKKIVFAPLSKSVDYTYVGLFLGFPFCSINIFICSLASTTMS